MLMRYLAALVWMNKATPEILKATDLIGIIGLVLFGIMVLVTLLSGVIYLVQNRFVFAENKQPTAESSAN